MSAVERTGRAGVAAVLVGAVLAGALGCGIRAPRTHEVNGRVEFAGGDVRQLAGGHVEAVLADDRSVQAAGEIREDGTFSLTTVHAGKTLAGARPGKYLARIVLSDEDSSARQRRQVPARRYSQYDTSGLSFEVPAEGVTLRVSAR
jgi:hypothetical protein